MKKDKRFRQGIFNPTNPKKYVGKEFMSWDRNGYTFDGQVIRKDGDPVNVPFCRECTSQPRCSKWNGKFPYERVEGKIKGNKYTDV